jgi:hypothetical protein
MKVGAEPKKVAILGGLVVVAAVALYLNVFAGAGQPSVPRPAPVAPAAPTAPAARPAAPVRRVSEKAAGNEFRPKMGGENRPDAASGDPALHLDLLVKLQGIEPPPAGRNLFQYGAAPPPPKPAGMPNGGHIDVTPPPPPPPPPPAGGTQPPPPAPLTFKYYGYKTSRASGTKLAFLLDGEDIIMAGENEVVKKRYRVVRIGPASIIMEDMQGKGQQTLPIEGQPPA